MHFSRVASFFLVFLGVGMFTLANPVAVADIYKRQTDAAVTSVLDTLKGTLEPVLAEINAAGQSGNATNDSIAPLFGAVTTALDTATAALGPIDAVPLSKRQANDAIASIVAGIIADIAGALDSLSASPNAIAADFAPSLDASLDQLLRGLEGLLAGLLNLVAGLLVDVAALLRRLAFGLTLASLGL